MITILITILPPVYLCKCEKSIKLDLENDRGDEDTSEAVGRESGCWCFMGGQTWPHFSAQYAVICLSLGQLPAQEMTGYSDLQQCRES